MKMSVGIVVVLGILGNIPFSYQSETDMVANSQSYSTVCYFTNWSAYRKGKGKFTPSNIKPDLCNYVIYAFAKLDESLDSIASFDPNVDIDQGFFLEVTALRKKGTDVLLGLGGWNESTEKYSKMMADKAHREKVVASIVEFLAKYNFIGIDIDIEYPGAYMGVIGTGSPDDKQNFVLFLQEIRKKLDEAHNEGKFDKKPLLSAAVTGNKTVLEVAYDVEKMVEVVDWLGVMTYDIHVSGQSTTGLSAPFEPQTGDDVSASVKGMMNLWLSKGAPAKKLVLGIPFYGPSFRLADENNNGINAPAEGGGDVGEYTGSNTTMAFYEIVDNVKNKKWKAVHEKNLGSYAYQGTNWVGYDDAADVAVKANYIREQGFFGGMIWALDFDYFQKDSAVGVYPLLTTLNSVMSGSEPYTNVKNLT